MKPVLLNLSLLANAVLLAGVGYLALKPPVQPPVGKPREDALPKLASASQVSPPAHSPVTAAPPVAWQSPADVQTWLRSTNAPLEVRYEVARAMLYKKYQAAYEAARFPPGMHKWQRAGLKITPGQIEQQAAIREQQDTELQQLMGADYLQARYGEGERLSGLPVEKIAEINQISRDSYDARRKLGDNGMRPDVSRLMDAEMKAEIRKVLTPGEYEKYEAYDTQEGQQFQRTLAGLDIDDETYLRVYRAVAAVKADGPPGSSGSRQAESKVIETMLGAEAAALVAMNQDSTFRQIGDLAFSSGLPRAEVLGKYQAMLQFYKDTQGWGPQTVPTEAQLALVRSHRDRLTEGLSDTDRTKFDRTSTGALMNRLLREK